MKTPTIRWAQNNTYIFVDIELVPKEDYKIDIRENEICFKQDEYECNLNLLAKIIVDKSKYRTNRIFEFVLKKEDDEEWKQLLENKNQYKIGVNWDKCDISDDEEEANGGMPDMSSLMGGQGGMPDMSSLMGGQGGMPGDFASMGQCCEDEDCEGCNDEDFEVNSDDELDDEELKKLEELDELETEEASEEASEEAPKEASEEAPKEASEEASEEASDEKK